MNKLKNFGKVIMTPYPRKYRFEGVDYSHQLRDNIVASVVVMGLTIAAPHVYEWSRITIENLKIDRNNRKKD